MLAKHNTQKNKVARCGEGETSDARSLLASRSVQLNNATKTTKVEMW